MGEGKKFRVERLTRKILRHSPQRLGQAVRLGAESLAVVRVADYRMAYVGHVDTDLVRAAGLQPAFDKRGKRVAFLAGEALKHCIARDGMASIGAVLRNHGATHAIGGAAKRHIDLAKIPFRRSPHYRYIGTLQPAFQAVVGKRLRQRLMRAVGLGDDHDARSVLVEAVDDARPLHAAYAGQTVTAMMDQRVDQGAGPVAGAGMHDQSGRLVDDDQFGILVEDVERDVFAPGFSRFGLGQADRHRLTGLQLAAWITGGLSAKHDGALADQRLDAAAGKIGAEFLRQPLVETRPGGVRAGFEHSRSGLYYFRRVFAIRVAHRASGYQITMARPALDDEEEKPLDPAVENVRRKLVRFVAINLGLLLIALMAVVGALVYKSRTAAPPATDAATEVVSPEGIAEGRIPLPSGARIVSQSLSGNRISLALELADGSRAIHLYDVTARRIVGRFVVTEE
jgi:hypothetical protein